jgi:diphthine synthase
MLFLIGLGLNDRGISKEGLLVLSGCHEVYLEGYTVDFPYDIEELNLGKKKIELIDRKDVESNFLLKRAKSRKVALLVYGDPLFATTHTTLLLDAQEQDIQTKVIHSASVFEAVSETGLQMYKFGKIASMPDWEDKGKSDSFIDIIKDNQSIKSHSLILCDIGLSLDRALEQLRQASKTKKLKLDKIVICSQLGTENQEIVYEEMSKLDELQQAEVKNPFCLIIPSDMHFLEKEFLEKL